MKRSRSPWLAALLWVLAVVPPAAAQEASGNESGQVPPGRGRMTGLPSRGGNEVVPLGSGRARLRLTLEPLEPLAVGDAGDVVLAEEEFLVRWLRRELPRRFPDVGRVEVVEHIWARSDGQGLAATRCRLVQIEAADSDVPRLRSFVTRLLAARRTAIVASFHLFSVPHRGGDGEPAVSLLYRETLEARLASLRRDPDARDLAALVVETRSGRDTAVSSVERVAFVRGYQTETVFERPLIVPLLGEVVEGVQARLSAIALPDGRRVAVAAELGVGSVRRPVERTPAPGVTDPGAPPDRYLVDHPRVDVVSWSSDRIVLGPDDAGFAVTGLAEPGTAAAESGPARELVLVCRVDLAPLPRKSLSGEVLGFDAELGLAWVRTTAGANCQPGQALSFLRAGKAVGRGEVVEVLGDVMTVAVRRGRIRRGDEVR